MKLEHLKKIYLISPNFIKKAYSQIPWDIRMGKEYRKTLIFLNESLCWSEEKWKDYQSIKLRELLKFCKTNIPYYQRQFLKYEIDVNAKNVWKEFYKIPFIDKSIVTQNINDFIPNKFIKSYSATTGGTTGKPMRTFYDKSSFHVEWAFKIFFWNKAIGYKPTDKKATFRGISTKNKIYVDNPIYNEIRFSPFSMDNVNMKILVRKLIDYNPLYIHGYPSAIEELSDYFRKHKCKIQNLKGIMLISENIYDYQKEKIEKIFNCKVYSFYGHSERVIFASMLDDLDGYFAHPAYGITELIDKNHKVIARPEKLGELVGTGFINKAMPLLRFRTADFSSWGHQNSENCFPKLNKIKGRWSQEYLIGKNGKKISLTALNMHSKVFTKIKKIQYIQNKIGLITLNLIPEVNFTVNDEKDILNQYAEKLGREFEIKTRYVSSLKKTRAGKVRFLIQNL